MTQTVSDTSRAAGRPAIDDHLALWLFVETERKRQGLKIRAFCAKKSNIFYGHYECWGLPNGREPISGSTLRRRYREARQELGLARAVRSRGWAAVDRDADDPMIRETRETLNFLVESLAA